MKTTLLFGAALFLVSAAPAPAEPTGQWMDARDHLALGNLPDSSEPMARFFFERAACRGETGQIAGATPTPAFLRCMTERGLVWVWDTPGEIAARQKAEQDERMRAIGQALGQALMVIGESLQPHGCDGNIQPNGYFSTQCY